MRVERKDFKIGQGGFSALKVLDLDESKVFTIIYDCGSITAKEKLKRFNIVDEVKEFNGDYIIDILVLSHLDQDHVNMAHHFFEAPFQVKKVVLPYLPDEAILLFLNSVSNSSKFSNLSKVADVFRGRGGESKIYYNLDVDPGDYPENINDFRTAETIFSSNNNPLDRDKDVLTSVVLPIKMRDGSLGSSPIQIIFFQPSYLAEDAKKLKAKSARVLLADAQSVVEFEAKIAEIKAKTKKWIHKDLNKTCVGMCVVSCRDKEIHLFTGDMSITEDSLLFLYKKLRNFYGYWAQVFAKKARRLGCEVLFKDDDFFVKEVGKRKSLCCYFKIHFQLPHHGSFDSINLKGERCQALLKHSNLIVMHGKNRKHHPHYKLRQQITKMELKLNSVTE